MTRLRVMPPLGCENDMRGRFTLWPFGDSHGTFYGTGATPLRDALVRA